MSLRNKHKSRSDLIGFSAIAESSWKKHRPKLYNHLKKQGILYDHLFEAGRQADQYMEQVQSQPGYNRATDYHAAEEVALRTWIHLPDVDDETDELMD